ncbi:MAG: T9SS type A sorting domain-containing protein [Saprospiraceae bacterium]|nr:T9SS type A sorting domain-containing protein [Saprospiraceae bacterium]
MKIFSFSSIMLDFKNHIQTAFILALLFLTDTRTYAQLINQSQEWFRPNHGIKIESKTIFQDKQLKTFINYNELNKLKLHSTESFQLKVVNPYKLQELTLTKHNLFTSNFSIEVDENGSTRKIDVDLGTHYTGYIFNRPNSNIAISNFGNELTGLILDGVEGQYELQSQTSTEGVFINLNKELLNITSGGCHTDDWEHYIESDPGLNSRTKEFCKRSSISIRTDYALFLKLNKDTQAVVKYVISLFNQVNSIYRKEDIQIALSQIVINTTTDKLPHNTANGDLNYIKNAYRNFTGNALLCLSGYNRNGKATLGGVAYINSLCLKTYAYAFANVEVSKLEGSSFIYDVYLAAHELGHVFGSRHTHACVWGPKKNQAIDNCGSPEGSCAPGPKPVKGTLMSYCHLSGKPGIDLNLGFGKEPGDLIRKTVNNSKCLINYSPTLSVCNKASQTLTANVECGDGLYSHYYFDNHTIDETDDILIASIQKNGQDIGSISDGTLILTAHTGSRLGSGKSNDVKVSYSSKNVVLSNRFWEIISDKTINKPIQIKLNYSDVDLTEIKASAPEATTEKLSIYTVTKPASANPDLLHKSVSSSTYKEYRASTSLSNYSWIHSKLNESIQSAEFNLYQLNSEIGLSYNRSNYLSKLSSRTMDDKNQFKLISNPITNSELKFEYFSEESTESFIQIQLIDQTGKSILLEKTSVQAGLNTKSIDINNLTHGMYYLQLQDQQTIITKAVIIP